PHPTTTTKVSPFCGSSTRHNNKISVVIEPGASPVHARMRAEERSEPLPTFAARRLIQCGRCVRFSCCCHGEIAMTKRPKTSRPIEINPDVMATFRLDRFSGGRQSIDHKRGEITEVDSDSRGLAGLPRRRYCADRRHCTLDYLCGAPRWVLLCPV